MVFHGDALDGILDETHYRSKYGVSNPNLPVLRKLKKAGVELFACGQNLAAENRDPQTIAREVRVASDALIVLMAYQNDGYALLSFLRRAGSFPKTVLRLRTLRCRSGPS